MRGFPTGDLMQLRDGILYVLTYMPIPPDGGLVFPGDLRGPRLDGGIPTIEDYDCFHSIPTVCGPPINRELGYLYLLYAFAVE